MVEQTLGGNDPWRGPPCPSVELESPPVEETPPVRRWAAAEILFWGFLALQKKEAPPCAALEQPEAALSVGCAPSDSEASGPDRAVCVPSVGAPDAVWVPCPCAQRPRQRTSPHRARQGRGTGREPATGLLQKLRSG